MPEIRIVLEDYACDNNPDSCLQSRKDLLCLLLQQEEDSLKKIRINAGIPLLIQGGANYSEPTNVFRNWGGPFLAQQPKLVEVISRRMPET